MNGDNYKSDKQILAEKLTSLKNRGEDEGLPPNVRDIVEIALNDIYMAKDLLTRDDLQKNYQKVLKKLNDVIIPEIKNTQITTQSVINKLDTNEFLKGTLATVEFELTEITPKLVELRDKLSFNIESLSELYFQPSHNALVLHYNASQSTQINATLENHFFYELKKALSGSNVKVRKFLEQNSYNFNSIIKIDPLPSSGSLSKRVKRYKENYVNSDGLLIKKRPK